MNPLKSSKKPVFILLVLAGLLWVTVPPVPCFGMGLDFGGSGGGGSAPSCAVDANPVITPGPFGSPLRIIPFDTENDLVADYSRKTVYTVSRDRTPVPFIKADGKVLSVAISPASRRQRAPLFFVGDDDNRAIYTYRQAADGSMRKKQLLRNQEGRIQALDMVYDENTRLLYVVDGLSRAIKVVSMRGRVVRLIGMGQLSDPKGLAIDKVTGELFVSDYGDPRFGVDASVKIFTLDGSLIRVVNGTFSRPQGLAVTPDRIYLVDSMLAQVLVFDRGNGTLLKTIGCLGSGEGHMLLPMDVALDSTGQNLHVADNRNMRITVLTLGANP